MRHSTQVTIQSSPPHGRPQEGILADTYQAGREGLFTLPLERTEYRDLTSSPFLLAGVLNHHLDSWKDRYPELTKELREGLYVDDLMTGGTTVEETAGKKVMASEVFEDATFSIHKWHSNAKELEGDGESSAENVTYAKQQLGGGEPGGKLLGLPWDRDGDTFSVRVTVKDCTTKREILSEIAKVYDPLGIASPVMLVAKLLYRDICDGKISWDAQLPEPLLNRWKVWQISLMEEITVPRPLALYRVAVTAIELNSFGDASSQGVCAAVYAVVYQGGEVTQGLVCARSRMAKRNLTIPCLELVAGHMAVNLVSNVARVLDSTVSQKLLCFGSEVKVNTDNSSRIGSRRSNSMTKCLASCANVAKPCRPEVAVEV